MLANVGMEELIEKEDVPSFWESLTKDEQEPKKKKGRVADRGGEGGEKQRKQEGRHKLHERGCYKNPRTREGEYDFREKICTREKELP